MAKVKFDKHTKDVRVDVKAANRVRKIDAPGGARHPALSHAAPSTMHDDGRATDTSPFAGPLGGNGTTRTWLERKRSISGLCPAFVFHGKHTFTVSFSVRDNRLIALDEDMKIVDQLKVPRRSIDWSRLFSDGVNAEAITRRLFRDTSGGAYFFVEDDGRVVIPTAENTMWRIRLENGQFKREDPFDFYPSDGGPHDGKKLPIPAFGAQVCADHNVCVDVQIAHRVIAALPTYEDEDSYWFATNLGLIGVVKAPPNASACYFDLNSRQDNPWARNDQSEQIQNSFAIGEKGAFIVSDRALYRLTYEGGKIHLKWRHEVARTPTGSPKPGHVGVGSGTTPTLVRDKYVAITDAADKMRLILCSQDEGDHGKPKHVESIETLDGSSQSACENSLVTFDNYLILGNTWGYVTPFERKARDPGVLGVEGYEIVGGGKLTKRWDSTVNVMSAPPKIGRANATLYAYTTNSDGDWTLLGMDPWSGDVIYRGVVYNDDERDHDNAWGTMGIGPNNQLYIAQWSGMLRIQDK